MDTIEEIYTNGYLGTNPYDHNDYEYNATFTDTNYVCTDSDMSFFQISDDPCIDAETLYLTGMELMEDKKHQEALEYLGQAYALGETKCLGLMISCCLMMKDYEEASVYFDHFIKHDFQDNALYFSLGNFYFVEAQITDCFDVRTEFFENALTCLTLIKCTNKDEFPTLSLLIGLCYYNLNDYSQAIRYLSSFVDVNTNVGTNIGIGAVDVKNVIEASKTLMCIYDKQSNVKKIKEYFKVLLDVEEQTGINVLDSLVDVLENPDILYVLGTIKTNTNTNRQLLYLKKASNKAHTNACFVLAQHYSSTNNFADASKYYKKAYDLGFTMCFNEMINCWYKCEDFTHEEYVEKHCLPSNADNWIIYDYLAIGFCEKNVVKALEYALKLETMVGDTHPTVHFVNATCCGTDINAIVEHLEKFFKCANGDVHGHLLKLLALKIDDCTDTKVLDKFMRFIVTNEINYKYYVMTKCSEHTKYAILNVLSTEGLITGVFGKEYQRLKIRNYVGKLTLGTSTCGKTKMLIGLGIISIILGFKIFVSRTRRFI